MYFIRSLLVVVACCGSLLSADELRIQPMPPPGMVHHIRQLGNNIVLTCSASSSNGAVRSAYISWKDNAGNTVPERTGSRRYVESSPDGNGKKLYITDIRASDEGSYYCMSSINGVQYEKNVSLVIHKPITFDTAPPEQHLRLGSTSLIYCIVSGAPRPTVSWRFRSQRLMSGERHTILPDGLQISGVNADDEGAYTCRAEVDSDGIYADRDIRVSVHVPPRLTQGPGKIEKTEGHDVVIECKATGSPLPLFYFYKNGELLVSRDNIEVDSAAGVIHFRPLSKDDSGHYNCTASNDVGVDSATGNLVVHVKAAVHNFSNAVQSESETATLKCYFVGYPEAQVSIRKAGQSTPYHFGNNEGGRIVLQKTSSQSLELKIKSLRPTDSSVYVCSARNAIGHSDKQARLTVNYKPRFLWSQKPVAFTWAGVTRNISCEPSAEPRPEFEWRRSGRVISNNVTFQIFTTNNASYLQVHVREVDQSWIYGRYTCVARNAFGETEISIDLRRASIPDAPKTVLVAETLPDAVALKVQAPEEDGGMPVIGYAVQHEDVTNYYNTSSGDRLLIKNLNPSTTYVLRVKARNEVGFGNHVQLSIVTKSLSVPLAVSIISPAEAYLPQVYRVEWDMTSSGGLPVTEYEFIVQQLSMTIHQGQNPNRWKVIRTRNDPDRPLQYFDIENLVPQSNYKMQIRAHNNAGWSDYSPEFYFKTPELSAGQLTAESHAARHRHQCLFIVSVLLFAVSLVEASV